MTHVDSNGIAFIDDTDPVDVLHTTINAIPTSVSSWINSKAPIWKVANASAAATLATTYPPSPSAPLYVHRQDTGGLFRNVGLGFVEIVSATDARYSSINRVADPAARDALTGASATTPIYADVQSTGTLERNAGSGWVLLAGVPVVVPPTYSNPQWGAPAAGSTEQGLTLVKSGNVIKTRSGMVTNLQTVSATGFGQFPNAITLPTGYRPAKTIRIPLIIGVTGASLHSGQAILMPDGSVTLQTTTAIAATPAGNVQVSFSAGEWIATS